MAAYAALGSLMHLIKQIQHHPFPPFYLDDKYAENLIQKVTFLQEFLEVHSHVRSKEVDRLQSHIVEAAYAAEDVIKTHVVDQILAQSSGHEKRISHVDFYQYLQKVMQDMDSIKEEATEVKEKLRSVQDKQQGRRSSMPVVCLPSSPPMRQNTVMGFDDVCLQLMDKLTRGQSNHQIIPIVGMGGIGKTTLARKAYDDPLIVQHFDILAWATISQEYGVRDILMELLLCQKNQGSRESLSREKEMRLRDRLYKSLFSRRYLIVLDDVWNIKAWEDIKSLFPNNNNGSAIIITTRLSSVALHFSGNHGDHGLQMNFLDDDISWSLFCKIVFGEDGCPLQLEAIGRKIARNCKGLPLAIVVIGGLLSKSKQTPNYWKYIAENLHSTVNLEDNEYCLKLLYLSYNHLPVHLKPCFLYMGIFKEDSKIYADNLIMKWVVEGFLKPISGKSLEEVAENYLEDLIARNLILVHKRKRNGKIASCVIHDLLRDLCLREIEKDKFLCVIRHHSPNKFQQGIRTHRRIAIHKGTLGDHLSEVPCALSQFTSPTRSIICHSLKYLPSHNFVLLRILEAVTTFYRYEKEEFTPKVSVFQLVNLRCLAVLYDWKLLDFSPPSSPSLLWNLQIIFIGYDLIETFEIWKLPLLRHVKVKACNLRDPGRDDFVLENLHTLSYAKNFRCSEEMANKIHNIKKLKIYYYEVLEVSCLCLNNLDRLHKLETFCCSFHGLTRRGEQISREDFLQNLTFPRSLRKLTMYGCYLRWEDISTKIGSLPRLQELKLKFRSFIGPKWETAEGQFLSLKFLLIEECSDDLECWTTDSTHFPCLEHLALRRLHELKEIPSTIGDIPTLQSIELYSCNYSLVVSAKKIVEEQKELGNEDLQLRIH